MIYYIQHKVRDGESPSAYLVSKYDFEKRVQDLKNTGLEYVVQKNDKKTTLIVID